ncbi:hypothetical protein COCON_G00037880 [Conger conger]|uniref:ZP domain-containing protein n=1 Tax=Conger conger TaxID=82655 RepID=A0A9Q1I7Y2_CONCO|nr:hypothetical protein COCON_G00037880 [Conger conger]
MKRSSSVQHEKLASSMWANKGFSFFALKMRIVGFCLCLLGYISFTASMQSETENDWQNNFLSDGTYEVEPSQKMMKARPKPKMAFYITGDSASAVVKQKKWFHYNNRGPLSAEAKAVMLPVTAKTPVTAKPLKPMVEALCHLDRMYVRIRKDAVKGRLSWKYLYFGNCRVNAARGAHYYFLYNMTRCGLRPQVLDDVIVFANVVRYLRKYTTLKNITRKPTFTVPVACRFPRFHRTYDFGIHPVLGFNATMPLPVGGGPIVAIVVLDANWLPLAPGAFYKLGQTMHFEIRGSGGRRVFAERCWFSATSKLHTTLTYTAIKNYGCLVDSMNSTRSRYQRTRNPSVMRLIVETFVFDNVAKEQVLTLHCSISVAKTATLYRKSCTYEKSSDMWHELDRRVDLLCLCCKGVCPGPPSPRHRTQTVSSMPWKMRDVAPSFVLNGAVELDPPPGLLRDAISGATPKLETETIRLWRG